MYSPRWNAIASHTATFTVIFIAEFATTATLIATRTGGVRIAGIV